MFESAPLLSGLFVLLGVLITLAVNRATSRHDWLREQRYLAYGDYLAALDAAQRNPADSAASETWQRASERLEVLGSHEQRLCVRLLDGYADLHRQRLGPSHLNIGEMQRLRADLGIASRRALRGTAGIDPRLYWRGAREERAWQRRVFGPIETSDSD